VHSDFIAQTLRIAILVLLARVVIGAKWTKNATYGVLQILLALLLWRMSIALQTIVQLLASCVLVQHQDNR